MIISKTPFRVSFAGGMSDIRDYYKNDYGVVVSTTIDKYVYITVNKKFDDKIRVSYSKTETVDKVEEISHPLFRESLCMVGIDGGIEITSIGDIPAGTGLGSSSAFTVGLLNALYAFKGKCVSADILARQASQIEIDILGEPIGKQDQFATAYGGLNCIRFNKDESVLVTPVIFSGSAKVELDESLMLFYTGVQRQSKSILTDIKEGMIHYMAHVDRLRDIAEEMAFVLRHNDILRFGELLHRAWMYKRKFGKVTTESIDRYYNKARDSGALGGKVAGAGGGGFLLLCCEKKHQKNVRESLSDLKEIPFHLESQGSRIIYVE